MKNLLTSLFKISGKNLEESKTFYQKLHQEVGIKQLVSDFYEIMETDPKADKVLATHPLTDGKIPQEIKDRLFMFLSGWLGGPNLFIEQVGAPMMRKRHLHIKIGEVEKKQWLYCMERALKRLSFKLSKKDKSSFLNSCTALGMRIKNQQ
jgi:hemoglobin